LRVLRADHLAASCTAREHTHHLEMPPPSAHPKLDEMDTEVL
jgi:hypothetical protein